MYNIETAQRSTERRHEAVLSCRKGVRLVGLPVGMVSEKGTLAILETLSKFTLEADKNCFERHSSNIKDKNLNAAAAVAGELRRCNLLERDSEALQGRR